MTETVTMSPAQAMRTFEKLVAVSANEKQDAELKEAALVLWELILKGEH